MRLTTRTNLAMRTLMYCAVNDHGYVRKHDIAEACNASENHLAQVVNALAQMGYITTQRGRAGGMRLAHPMRQISVGEVFRRFEADVPFTECFAPDSNTCPLFASCRLRLALVDALEAFYRSLDSLSLGDLVEDNIPLDHLLSCATVRHVAPCRPAIPTMVN